jgi:hypothetical protein
MNYSDYLAGVEHGLRPGIPNINQQPWKVLEVAIANTEECDRAILYEHWKARYQPGKPSKRQKIDLGVWGI